MTSTERLEREIDVLEKKKQAIESDLQYKERQYNQSMPTEEGMQDDEVALLMLTERVRDRDQLEVEIAEKRLALYDLQGGAIEEEQRHS